MSLAADDLMEAQRQREERERKLHSSLTVGDLRAILDNIPKSRDNVPVVVRDMDGHFYPLTTWRGEQWRGGHNVLSLYMGE